MTKAPDVQGSAATRWWGWGREGAGHELGPETRELLRREVGPAEPSARVEIDDVRLPEARQLPPELLAAAGSEAVSTGREGRVRHATGRSYPDLIRLRTGKLEDAPDAVVVPADASQLAAVIEAAARAGVAVVPFGGGTSAARSETSRTRAQACVGRGMRCSSSGPAHLLGRARRRVVSTVVADGTDRARFAQPVVRPRRPTGRRR